MVFSFFRTQLRTVRNEEVFVRRDSTVLTFSKFIPFMHMLSFKFLINFQTCLFLCFPLSQNNGNESDTRENKNQTERQRQHANCFFSLCTDLSEIDVNTFLGPFLDVIRSEDTTGPITGVALSSVNKFLSYGLVGMCTKLVTIHVHGDIWQQTKLLASRVSWSFIFKENSPRLLKLCRGTSFQNGHFSISG